MNKKMREIFAQIEAKTKEAQTAAAKKDFDGAEKLMNEVEQLQKEFDVEKRIYEAEKQQADANKEIKDPADPKKGTDESATTKFAKFVRGVIAGRKDIAIPSESIAENGGYTVPEDIQTQINHYAEAEFSFLNEIDVVPVSTNKGARTYQKKGKGEVFVDLDENGAITGQIAAPQFERVTYNIQDRAGFMPVSNDLINDSDANILGVVSEWLGKCDTATTNAKVLALVNQKDETNFKNINGLKKAVNVTLGQAYKAGVKIYTNDDGLQYLDELVDKNDRPLLNPDPTDTAKLQLRCGVTVVPVVVVPNDTMTTSGTKIPFIVGDLKSAIRKWDRQKISIDASSVASIGDFNAFEKNMTLLRAIVRDDYTELDGDAFVRGSINTAAAAASDPA